MDCLFSIRKAVPEDAGAIRAILQESFKKYIKAAGITSTLEALEESEEDIHRDIKDKEVLIAFLDKIPVGTIRVQVFPDNTAYISRFGVMPQYHNIGVGKALINLVDRMLISKGVSRVSLHTASKYGELVRFYYGRGFYVDSTTKDKGYVRALMVKEY